MKRTRSFESFVQETGWRCEPGQSRKGITVEMGRRKAPPPPALKERVLGG